MSIEKRMFGATADGSAVTCWRLTHPSGAAVEILDFGAVTRVVEVPDRNGRIRSVCMGFDSVSEYEQSDAYSGAIVGRHAGRIRGAEFSLNGVNYSLSKNHGDHHHHGGFVGFDREIWTAEADGDRLTFSYTSPDGEEGYPGTLTVTASYEWTEEMTLTLTLDAVCDRDTVVSLTHHGYWNLSGEDTVSSHLLQIDAPTVVAADQSVLPTGEFASVEGTEFDFREPKMIGCAWDEDRTGLFRDCGYDHTFPVPGMELRELGVLSANGMEMTVSSTLPTLHVYTGKQTHVALEAQFIPDAVHHENFPSTVLNAGDRWHHVIEYRFRTV